MGDDPHSTARRMAAALAHRGPDAEGTWVDEYAGIALTHRRLSIIDLSPLGSQPMVSPGGRFVIVFNGEVYNYAALRKELEAGANPVVTFRGHSDTEVMLAAIEAWGLEAAVRRFAKTETIEVVVELGRAEAVADPDGAGVKALLQDLGHRLCPVGAEVPVLELVAALGD